MEKLLVSNFLTIKEAEFDVGRINVIIGPQASGKSILAKLLYFFREFLSAMYLKPLIDVESGNDITKEVLLNSLFDIFKSYFPEYSWKNKDFEIVYKTDKFDISLKYRVNNSANIQIDYSDSLQTLYDELKCFLRKIQDKFKENRRQGLIVSVPVMLSLELRKYLLKTEFGSYFRTSLFIPAGRSFFVNLQKNIFSLLSENIAIDPFLISFGSQYESARSLYKIDSDITDKQIADKINRLVRAILVGEYKHEDGRDWIINNDTKIELSNASSGQQESLPMLLIMSGQHFISSESTTFFIEEPEAHLFPVSQKHIMSLISLLYYRFNHDFVITTHSPYILTAMNNLILAHDVSTKLGQDKLPATVDPDCMIKYEDVRAYTIDNGKLVNIKDDELRLIGVNVIDSVSDDFASEFDELLSLLGDE
jgi:AAA15 family ATPase/GTPase